MRVAVDTDEVHGVSVPRGFRLDVREIEVVEVLDQWFGADYRYCKVKGSDGALYILRLDENHSQWTLDNVREPKSPGHRPAIRRLTCGLGDMT